MPTPAGPVTPLAGARLLVAWEAGLRADDARRPVALVAVACDLPFDDALDLPLGRRDAALLRLRVATFGDPLPGLDRCPGCAQEVEFRLPVRELLAGRPDDGSEPGNHAIELGDWHVDFRPATTRDLIEGAASGGSEDEVGTRIVRRCVVRAERGRAPEPIDALPSDVLEAVARAQLEHDPLSEILIRLDCPACRQVWESRLDCGAFFWRELSVAARRLLRQVHRLASAYGWSEDAILALAPERRQAYVDLVEAVSE